MATDRDSCGRFKKKKTGNHTKILKSNVLIDHNYPACHVCYGDPCKDDDCPLFRNIKLGKYASRDGWKEGRRIVELGELLSNLVACKYCKLGPIPLTYGNIVGEMRKGLSGYLYVKCQNVECGQINMVPYGKTHREKKGKSGMPCFVINTKLGTAMIDSVGGPDRMNNLLSTLNIKPINQRSLKSMERRAGGYVEAVAKKSTQQAANDSFRMEMEDIAEEESRQAAKIMGEVIEDLGVCPLPDAPPEIRLLMSSYSSTVPVVEASSGDESGHSYQTPQASNIESPPVSCSNSVNTPSNLASLVAKIKEIPQAPHKQPGKKILTSKKRVRLASRFPCKTRSGMSCAVDTAWHKRGFDSLTSHTFFMSKAKYGKKVVKALVGHRTCGTCKWWMRNRPGLPIRKHRCVLNHFGSARLMECKSGVQGIKELSEGGTPVDYLEGDGDNTMIAHIKSDLNITMKKRFDRNHVVKNIGKSLYALQGKKLSRSVIMHIQKCLKYAFAKNQGNKEGLEKNLKALIPHQFGDHSLCFPRFCGFRRTSSNEKYTHKSLPYKAALKDDELQSKLKKLFKPVIANAEQYADLGSSQQCEHANREVTLRAPKSLHYGNSESLDFRVAATTAFINEGRSYVSEVNMAAGISPGTFSVKYAAKQMKRRKRVQRKSQLPSTKRRRVTLKQERVIAQGANEVLEGTTYESGIGHTTNVDVEQLPEAVPRGKFATVSAGKEATVITFDLETTDLIRGGKMPHITQIAASDMETGKGFSTYVLPKVPISTTAQQVTGIIVNNSGTMTVNGKQVQPETVQFAVDKFCKWLSGFPNVFLLAHNGRRFDFPVFSSALINIQCEAQFFNCVSGLIDSLPVFKKAFPGQSSYKQEELAKTFLHSSYEAHNAIEDVKVLGKLVSHTKMKIQELARYSFPPSAVHNLLLFNKEKAKHIKTLHSLLAQGVMKMSIAEKIAGSGLNLGHLRKIFQRDGEDGLRNTFTCKNSEGQPRVTDVKKTLDDVIPKLVLFF